MTDPDGQIDDELRAAGEHWRASRPTHVGGVDPALLIAPRAQEPRVGRVLASLAGVALLAIVGATVLFVFASRPPDHAVSIASPSPTAAATVPGSSPSLGPSPSAAPIPTFAPIPTVAAPSPNPAEVACSAILDNIPSTVVKSGDATLAAAYEVTGAQLTSYFVKTLNANANQSNGSDWWDQPTKLVDMCLYDGDFDTQTPGPPGHDTSAVRVLVVISDGDAQLWAISRDKAALPTTDPRTVEPDGTPVPVPTGYSVDIANGQNPQWTAEAAAAASFERIKAAERATGRVLRPAQIVSVQAMSGRDVPSAIGGPYGDVPVVWVVHAYGTFENDRGYSNASHWLFDEAWYIYRDSDGFPVGEALRNPVATP